jgi:hypothetical protein
MPAREMPGRAVSPDSSRIIEIENSPGKLVILCGLGVLMTALSAAVAIPLFPNFHPRGVAARDGARSGRDDHA